MLVLAAMTTVAALYVAKGGCYFGLPDVDPWDEARDARAYAGPHPVVAHPPCARWCRLAGLVEARWGHKRGEDGGCFISALRAVEAWGGVLEHPAWSDAWPRFGIPSPPRHGGWLSCGDSDGRIHPKRSRWTCHVEQGRYGHPAKKATWLYAALPYGVAPPTLEWGSSADQHSKAWVSWCGNHTRGMPPRPRIGKRVAAATPIPFRDLLLSIARSVTP